MPVTEEEIQQARQLLNELGETKPEDLPDWNIKAQTLLVFTAMKHPEVLFDE